MKKRNKALLIVMCAVMLMAASILGTMAYLTDQEQVTNTFTVGNVYISLDEAKVNPDGSYVTNHDNRTAVGEGNAYHLLPGRTYYKDPTVTVEAGSEDAYVRMIVTVSDIEALKSALPGEAYKAGEVFLLQMLCQGWSNDVWEFVETEKTKNGVYEFRYVGNDSKKSGIVVKNANATVLPDLFTSIIVPGEISNENLAKLNQLSITVVAHAIQAAGFESAADAWAVFVE